MLYPAVHLHPLPGTWQAGEASSLPASLQEFLASDHVVFLSINRFERKKASRQHTPEPAAAVLAEAGSAWCIVGAAQRAAACRPQPPGTQNIALAVRALEVALRLPASGTQAPSLLRRLTSSSSSKRAVRPLGLVLAGGYDQRLLENREVLAEMQGLARDLGVQDHVRALWLAGRRAASCESSASCCWSCADCLVAGAEAGVC